jgi:hypothetical protein
MPAQLEITHCADGLLMAVLGPVCIAFWQTKPIPRLFQIQRAHLAKAVARNPGKVAFLCAVAEKAPPPDEPERAASAAMINGHAARLAAVACVIEGSGFRAAITRTVLSGMVFVIRSPSPIRMFETVGLATPWLRTRLADDAVLALPVQFELARSKLSAVAA